MVEDWLWLIVAFLGIQDLLLFLIVFIFEDVAKTLHELQKSTRPRRVVEVE